MNIVKEPDAMGFVMAFGLVMVVVVVLVVLMVVAVVVMMVIWAAIMNTVAYSVAFVVIDLLLIVPVVRLVPMALNIVCGLTVAIALRRLSELEQWLSLIKSMLFTI